MHRPERPGPEAIFVSRPRDGHPLRRSFPARITLAALVLLLAAIRPAGAVEVSPSEILAAPDRFDGQAVTLQGLVTNYRARVSQRGNAYYTFDLSDGRRPVRVFSFGDSPCEDGMTARVEGTFEKLKRQAQHAFHNEVTATRVTCR